MRWTPFVVRTWLVLILLVNLGLVALASHRSAIADEEKKADDKKADAKDDGTKSIWAKALEGKPGLRAKLEKSEVYKELKNGLPKFKVAGRVFYVAEGDLRLDEDALLFYAQERTVMRQRYELAKDGLLPTTGVPPTGITLGSWNGQPVLWTPGTTLKYCFLKDTFSDDELTSAKDAFVKATKTWSDACNIKFERVADKTTADLQPGGLPPVGATFTVRKQVIGNSTIAASFFPYWPKQDWHVFLDPSWFTPPAPFSGVGILRHELGHVLGFRHEHIRSEAPPQCGMDMSFPGEGIIPLSAYDPQSIMHYPCGEFMNYKQDLTPADKTGAVAAYGGPPPAGKGAGFGAPPPRVVAGTIAEIDPGTGKMTVIYPKTK